ncbi:MAG: hypothetical protein PHX25_00525 [Candidatus Pacebacteria bacterium]|nr:hypothetical protein [Candidatus Paceibacterota bacterium]
MTMAELIGPQWINALFSVSLTAVILSLLFIALRMFLNNDEKKLVEKIKKIGHAVITEKIYIDQTTCIIGNGKMPGSFERILGDGRETYDSLDNLPKGEFPHIEIKYFPIKNGVSVRRIARVNLTIFNKQMFD